MITTNTRTFLELLRADRGFFFGILFFSVVLYYINENYNLALEIPSGSLQVIGLFIAFFLVFMSQKSYERWWEARMIWGDIVNKSRSWAMQVNHMIDAEKLNLELEGKDAQSIKRDLIYGQIGFVNALRIHLRRQGDFSPVKDFFSEKEYLEMNGRANFPTQVLDLQASKVKHLLKKGVEEMIVQAELNKVLKDLYDCQGMSERIKNTVFPKPYTFFARLIVYVYVIILPIYMINSFLSDSVTDLDFFAVPLVVFISLVFFSLTKLAEQYENPFENTVHDIPLTAICNTIEVDLKELCGEEVKPHTPNVSKGVVF